MNYVIYKFECRNPTCRQFKREWTGLRPAASRCWDCGNMQRRTASSPLSPTSELHKALVAAKVQQS